MRKITNFMQLMIIVLVSLFATTNLKAQSHFVFEGGNPADPVYTIYFFGATLNGVDLQAGDEIAVYDGTKMVGAAVLTSVCASENYNNFVSAFKTLTSGTGYVPGHPVTFKCWDASAGVEATDFTINYLDLYNAWIQDVFPSEDGIFSLTEVGFTHATNIPVTGVVLDPSTLNLIVNETGQLTATISPENATNQLVAWSTTNNSVATVDQTGLVTASGAGTAKIVVTTDDGGFTDTCYVTVSAANIPVSGVTIQPTTMNLYVTETGQLTETVVPPDATNKNVTWSSTNEAIATVNATGLVTAVSEGVAKVAVTTVDGGFSDTCTVTVSHVPIAPVLVSAVGGDQQVTLTWTPVPAKKGRTATHFSFEGGNAADPVYTLYFFGATLNGMNLEAGDEIA
ncbi:MAG TPA: Ig domain-containing protein, partial [Bacteroidales bacterium]|nr:Ig domain-containing protein [Bacteroidales bacterium]